MKIGLDIGSTTIKCVVLGDKGEIVYQSYERHYSHIVSKAAEVLRRIEKEITGQHAVLAISGSAGMGLADIAVAMGFNDQSYFTKVFHKYTGLTPAQFR